MEPERKKAEVKRVVTSLTPKKRENVVEPKKVVETVKEEPKKDVVPVRTEPRPKRTDKYIRLAANAEMSERQHFADRVQKGEIALAYYAIDGDQSYHYYIVNIK
jgi:hypothetical protein